MPKITELPEETFESNSTSFLIIDDVETGQTKKISVANFRKLMFSTVTLSGPAMNGAEFNLLSNSSPTLIVNYSEQTGNGAQKTSGRISTVSNDSERFRVTTFIHLFQSSNVVFEAGISLSLDIVSSGLNIPVVRLISEEWFTSIARTNLILSSSFIVDKNVDPLIGSLAFSLKLRALEKDLSLTILSTNFHVENI